MQRRCHTPAFSLDVRWLGAMALAVLSTQCAAQTQLVIQVPSDMIPETDLQSVTIKVTRLDAMGQPMPIPITEQTLQIGLAATDGKKTIPLELGVFAARADDSRRVLVTVSGRRVSGAQAQTSAVVAFFPNKTVFYTLYLSGACTPAVNEACEQRGLACGMEGGMQGICVERIRSTAAVLENGMRREVPVPPMGGSDADVPSGDATIDGMVRDVPTMDVPVMDVPTVADATDASDTFVPIERDVPVDPGILAPRLVAPMSTSSVSSHRPTLKWDLPAGTDGAVITVCRDRAMTDRCSVSNPIVGRSNTITLPQAESGWFYWSLSGTRSTIVGNRSDVVWQYWVPSVNASMATNTVFPPRVDFNGDGFADIAVGAPHTITNGQMNAGSVSIYHGAMGGLSAAPTRTFTLDRDAMGNDLLGAVVAGIGDVNGDGYSDLAVAVQRRARVDIYYGGAMGIGGAPSLSLDGAMSASFGASIASAGDVNGDGFGDVAVGDSSVLSPGPGRVLIYLGSRNGLSLNPSQTLQGSANGDTFGRTLAGGGDVNGDGYGDLCVGAPFTVCGPMRVECGAVAVYHGGQGGLSPAPVFSLPGLEPGGLLARSAALVGDMNGDGFADIVVGAADQGGSAIILAGSAMGVVQQVNRLRTMADTRFAFSLAGAGDVNNDGLADLVIGSPVLGAAFGAMHFYLGSVGGYTQAISTRVMAPSPDSSFAEAVAGAGDVNNDGFGEVLVGAWSAEMSRTGHVYVYPGSNAGIVPMGVQTFRAPMGSSGFGYSIAQWLRPQPMRRMRWSSQGSHWSHWTQLSLGVL